MSSGRWFEMVFEVVFNGNSLTASPGSGIAQTSEFLSAKQWGRERIFSITRPTRIHHAGGSISLAAGGTSSTGPRKPNAATRPSRGSESTSGRSNTASEPAGAAGRRWNSGRT